MSQKILSQIISEIEKAKTIFIAGHARPDGDTVGSSLALKHALKKLGKKVDVYSKEIIPDYLKFLPGSKSIRISSVPASKKYDLAIILECSDLERMGNIFKAGQAQKIINIDHHLISNPFGDINYIEPLSSSTCYQVYLMLKNLGVDISKDIATCLYTGTLTDTGKFQQKNTTPEAYSMASELLKKGINLVKINDFVYGNRATGAFKLLGAALTSLEISGNGKVAFMTLTMNDFKKNKATQWDTEGIINYPLSIKGVGISVLFREIKGGFTKVSMRSKGNFDLTKLAKRFNGGGHKHAAGFTLNKSIEDAKKTFLKNRNKIS